MTGTESQRVRMLLWWPGLAGVLFAAGMIVLLWIGRADAATAADILTAAAFVYLGSAALGHRGAAWPLFGLTFVLIGIGLAVRPFPAFLVMVLLGAVLAVYGVIRGRLRPADGLPLQAAAMTAVLLLVLLAGVLDGPWPGILAGVGLFAHALWDVRHLRTRRVVAPSMAEFCAALDLVLAAGVVAVSLR
ncbi:hypothetical protein [Microbacterium hydrocarbonoxydans]|uniref:hypothetical protein n=1 Tax=Microbacterium hydrocarbonoxydans TaxID=273678 RepID=UPI0013DD6FC6|nr:hypothetical protein [Microbacterium hydrocarbonoxydans]